MSKRYNLQRLKAIGEQCKNKLPPASTIQAMFLYEMHCETETEKLFQGPMFRLARVEKESTARMAKLGEQMANLKELVSPPPSLEVARVGVNADAALETRMKELEEQMASLWDLATHIQSVEAANASYAALETRMEKLQEELTNLLRLVSTAKDTQQRLAKMQKRTEMQEENIDLLGRRLDVLGDTVQEQDETLHPAADPSQELTNTLQHHTTNLTALNDLTATIDAEITVLFSDRHEMLARLTTADARIQKLEDLVRALTLHKGGENPTTTTSTQHLPVRTRDGCAPEGLKVPKGRPLVAHSKREAFTPGPFGMR